MIEGAPTRRDARWHFGAGEGYWHAERLLNAMSVQQLAIRLILTLTFVLSIQVARVWNQIRLCLILHSILWRKSRWVEKSREILAHVRWLLTRIEKCYISMAATNYQPWMSR